MSRIKWELRSVKLKGATRHYRNQQIHGHTPNSIRRHSNFTLALEYYEQRFMFISNFCYDSKDFILKISALLLLFPLQKIIKKSTVQNQKEIILLLTLVWQ
jgi:hypothetical protein